MHTVRTLIVALVLFSFLGSPAAAAPDEYDDSQSNPLRVAAYLLYPAGWLAEWLIFLRRYGKAALGVEEVERLERRFKRFYCRRLLRWRFVDNAQGRVQRHLDRLRIESLTPTLLEYADAQLIAARCGGCLLVTERDATRLADIEAAKARLAPTRAKLVGAVMLGA